ncbi:hypothetical protein STK_13444 [Sulfurisphaera tokodaii str. 7]|uniref:Uncharacterized protein n=2 Tax=Sulfurisphaera tokodaii TaxID=111955 RepID=Q971L5_SULTO|nr:hypothetical protein STK_13444 [Sulfurisphaera tokodaii str. 7]
MNLDERTLEKIADCWVRFRRVMHVSELDEDCKHVICTFLLKIAEDDKDFIDDLEIREDVEFCQKSERKPVVPGVL